MPDAVFEPGDADMTLLAVRRITFEWVLRRHVLDSGRVAFRDGDEVTGLAAERDPVTGLPRVFGVYLLTPAGDRELLRADLVVDASGRRSRLPDWLEAIGAKRPAEESELCGIFYSSASPPGDGVEPPVMEGEWAGSGLPEDRHLPRRRTHLLAHARRLTRGRRTPLGVAHARLRGRRGRASDHARLGRSSGFRADLRRARNGEPQEHAPLAGR
jgi:hypothetical protein